MGKLIAIDGVDASGKQTHTELLRDHLKNAGYKVRSLSFPMYDKPTSALVKMYLSGELGKTADDVDAYCASSLFAADRFASYRSDWQKDFEKEYLENIQYVCLVMSQSYIENHFADIQGYASVIESRLDDSDLNKEELITENEDNLDQCIAHNLPYILIDGEYSL